MGAVFQEGDIMTITGIHVGDFSAHVGDEAEFAVGVFDELFFEVIDIHYVIVV